MRQQKNRKWMRNKGLRSTNCKTDIRKREGQIDALNSFVNIVTLFKMADRSNIPF